jgi:hypothetical protein
LVVPVITAGNGFTVNNSVRKHPVDAMVLVIFAVPVPPVAVTIPVDEPTPATGMLSLDQVPTGPEPKVSVSAGSPIHILVGVHEAGAGLMFIFSVVKQPVVVTLYTMIAVVVTVAVDTPVTSPEEEPTVAFVMLKLLHIPGPSGSDNDTESSSQTLVGPTIGEGKGFTVML